MFIISSALITSVSRVFPELQPSIVYYAVYRRDTYVHYIIMMMSVVCQTIMAAVISFILKMSNLSLKIAYNLVAICDQI